MEQEQPSITSTTSSIEVVEAPSSIEATTTVTPTNGVLITEQKEKGDILKEALHRLVQGKRHLLVKDITSAIISLGESCQLLVEANGALSPENAEAHFYYGKALLEQSRLDLSVFGGAVAPENEGGESGGSEEDEEEDAEEEEKDSNSGDGEPLKEETTENEEENESEAEAEAKPDGLSSLEEETKQQEEDISTPSPVGNSIPVPSTSISVGGGQDNEQPSSSSGITQEGDTSGVDKEGEEELSNLEMAWEVLEIAKLGYVAQLTLAQAQLDKKTDDGEDENSKTKTKLHLQKRLAETHSLLGEVATESENYPQAVEDFKTAITILTEIEGEDSREVAQYYFQTGLAYAFAKEFQLGIASFEKSKAIIEVRIRNLQAKIDDKQTIKDLDKASDDSSYNEGDEISELKALLPELDEKIADTIDAEREGKVAIAEEIQEREIALKNSPVKNPNPPAINDISHLVKKKKKAEEPLDVPPPKRVCSDSTISTSKTDEATNVHENGTPKKSLEA